MFLRAAIWKTTLLWNLRVLHKRKCKSAKFQAPKSQIVGSVCLEYIYSAFPWTARNVSISLASSDTRIIVETGQQVLLQLDSRQSIRVAGSCFMKRDEG